MPSVYFDPALGDEERRRDLTQATSSSATPGTRALVSLARKMLENAFALMTRALDKLYFDVRRLRSA